MFAKAFIEITNECNLACPFCPPTRRRAASMSREDFSLVLDRVSGQVEQLYFHVKGEPLLHPELASFLALAQERGFKVSITTNGTQLGERAQLLLDSPAIRKLSVSLHSHVGLVPEGQDADMGPEDSVLKDYWEAVLSFLDRHREKPAFPVSLRLWNRREGALPPTASRLEALMRERWPGLDLGAAARSTSGTRLEEKVYLNPADEFEWPDASLPDPGEGRPCAGSCHGLRNQFAVLVDLSVVPCCLDGEGAIHLGDLRSSQLDAILESPRARAIRDGFARRLVMEPMCRSCGYRLRFDRKA